MAKSELSGKPLISLKPGEELAIEEVSMQLGYEPAEVLADLRNVLTEHYRGFGTRAFICEYSPKRGHTIYASSNVGWLSGALVDIMIEPKIPGLNIGKCLGLSQYVKNTPASFAHKDKISALLSKDTAYSPVEYIAFSFLDALYTLLQNGLSRTFEEVIVASRDRGGTIVIQQWIDRGLIPPPLKASLEPTIDILPNQIIANAIDVCLLRCRAHRLQSAFRMCREQFKSVRTDFVRDQDLDAVFLHKFNLPRPDYARALTFAFAILRGCAVSAGSAEFLPSLTIDLDRLFEEYCSEVLRTVLSPEKFEVMTQAVLEHKCKPAYNSTVQPDIVVNNRATGRSIVLDLKNKYSGRGQSTEFQANNPDLYQMCYYLRTVGCSNGILVYPACAPTLAFPMRGSESEATYEGRINAFMERSSGFRRRFFSTSSEAQDIHSYYVDLGGSMANSMKSIASLALFIEHVSEH